MLKAKLKSQCSSSPEGCKISPPHLTPVPLSERRAAAVPGQPPQDLKTTAGGFCFNYIKENRDWKVKICSKCKMSLVDGVTKKFVLLLYVKVNLSLNMSQEYVCASAYIHVCACFATEVKQIYRDATK